MNNIIERIWKQGGLVNIEDLRGSAFQAEESAHTFRIRGVDENGEPLTLTGTCAAIFLRADNTDVAITGTITDGAAEITLTDECYDMPGRFGLTIYVTSEEQTVAVYAAIGSVCQTSSGTVSPETGEDVMDLINAINDAIEDLEEAIAKIPEDYQELEDDVAALQSDVEDIQGDVETLQGKVNDFAPVILNNASGEIVSITDGAGDMKVKKLEVEIEPVQDLHGYDNPWPAGASANKFNEDVEIGGISALTGLNNNATDTLRSKTFSKIGSSVGFIAVMPTSLKSTGIYMYYYDNSQQFISAALMNNANGLTGTSPSTAVYFKIVITSAYGTTYNHNIGINTPATETSYIPYSNECPISGWDSANVSRTGINIWDEVWEVGSINPHTGANADSSSYCRTKNYIPIIPNTNYWMYLGTSPMYMRRYNRNKEYLGFAQLSSNSNWTCPADTYFIRFCWDGDTYNNNISVNYPSSDTQYHPGQVEQIEYEFPDAAGTVYGAKLTIHQDGSGELVVDIVKHSVPTGFALLDTINGVCRFSRTRNNVWDEIPKGYSAGGVVISNALTPVASIGLVNPQPYTVSVYESANDLIRIALPSTVADTAEKANQWITDNGIEVAYEVATPVTYQLTNQQVLELLKGSNVCFADCGSVSLEYPADTKLYIDGKIAEVQALILENISNS